MGDVSRPSLASVEVEAVGAAAVQAALAIDPANATADQMLAVPGFRAALSEHISNSFEEPEQRMSPEELMALLDNLGALVYGD